MEYFLHIDKLGAIGKSEIYGADMNRLQMQSLKTLAELFRFF